ncbi:MAG: HAMP domain-containing histidine kinase, partial [Bacteroidales bacterium]|nr:HAMP domain-containing histidine kinase [Bacteroidales bacterium]
HPDEYKKTISSVLDDIKHLTDISNRLLLLARTSAEGPANYSSNIRIDDILWQTREEILKFNNSYNITIKIPESITDSDCMLVTGDESLLKVAFSNIIDNACKYSADKSVEIKIGSSNHNVEIVFEDHGSGIPKDELPHIFEPFYRAANSKSVPGSGIGLPLVNQIIKNHNGKINIISKQNIGTQVFITLPSAV